MASSNKSINRMLTSSASGATFLVMIQVVSRGLTFAANQILLRHISPETLGISTQLELYSITTLYFSRESVRIAIQRQPLSPLAMAPAAAVSNKDQPDEHRVESTITDESASESVASQSVVNVSYICLALGIPLVTILAVCYLHIAQEEVIEGPYFRTSLKIIGIASLLELATEPFFAVVQQRMLYRTRAVVETSAAVAKSFLTCSITLRAACAGWDPGVLPIALGYMGYSVALLFGYFVTMFPISREKHFSFCLISMDSRDGTRYLASRFSFPLVSLGVNVFFQSVVKHLLTQGDSIMLAAMSNLEDQGVYSLASNYGGLLARILFQPIEDSSRNLFSKLLASGGNGRPNIKGVSAAKAHLVDIIRVYGVLSILAFSLAPAFVPLILGILIGSRWTSPNVASLLSTYCYYIPFLAFNGITEAFVSSAASPQDLRKQAVWMGVFSACSAAMAYLFLQVGGWGAHGLVWINVINMALRTIWSYSFIKSYLNLYDNDLTLPEISLRYYTYGAGTIIMSIMRVAERLQATDLHGITKITGLGIVSAFLILYLEKEFLIQQYTKIRPRKAV